MNVFNSIDKLIGRTPILELCRLESDLGLSSRLFAKLEYLNPTGSAKDRASLYMLNVAEAQGLIGKGSVIIEPTSGNTGIGLACIGARRGYRVIIVMPDTMSKERIKSMELYGAEVVLTDGKYGMSGAIEKAKSLSLEIPNSFIPSQFDNKSNSLAHLETTGPEIYEDMDGQIDYFVCAVGTGGTITGVGEYLKSKSKDIKIVAVEPQGSPFLSRGIKGSHKIQGIGAGFAPSILNQEIYDEIITVSDEDAYKYTSLVCKSEGACVGLSSGAVLSAGIELAKRESGKNIVMLFPDTGLRYLSEF
ncbi:MAG: cysteine synthase A [Clostridia bacterium]|nr:cysteine synthase A [Clostridia bacterium]